MTQEEFNAMLEQAVAMGIVVMTQETFDAMLQTAIAEGLPGGYYTMKYSGEETDALLDWVSAQQAAAEGVTT